MTKKKILFVGEASYLASGFGTYAKEILSRLYNTNKYHLAEFASYGAINDPRDRDIKWRFYANTVQKTDPRYKQYKSQQINEFGMWRFEKVLLDFKPDIVFGIRDYWMDAYITDSPLRPFFHWVWMVTADSMPQKDEWIETYMGEDSIFTYTDWNMKELAKEGHGKINLYSAARPGVDLVQSCPPKNKRQYKIDKGIDPDSFIIGTVMRNQKRKLFADLFRSFRLFLEKCYANNQTDLAHKTFLYCHTTYPEGAGWDIPKLLAEECIGHKVIFTYKCRACKKPFSSFFQDGRTICPHCNSVAAVLPSPHEGISRKELTDIYKLFDLYIQYAICEGFGLGLTEAAACGVPLASVDYSATTDIIKYTDGFPLKIQRMFRELESHSYRALPDNEYCANFIYQYLNLPEDKKILYQQKARRAVEKYYNWDNTAKIWEDYFDNVVLKDLQGKWNHPPRFIKIPPSLPEYTQKLNNKQFITWIITNIWNRPNQVNSRFAMEILRDLNHGAVKHNNKLEKITREDIFKNFALKATIHNKCEQIRCGLTTLPNEDFIQYAHLKEKVNQ